MFPDTRAEKIKNILIPAAVWIAAGMAGELLGVLWEAIRLRGSEGSPEDFMGLLAAVHEEGEIFLLLFRDTAAAAVLLFLFRRDGKDPAAEKRRLPPAALLLSILLAAAYCVFMNLLLAETGLLKAEENGGAGGLLTLLHTLLLAPITEELLCRGLIYRRVRSNGTALAALLISAGIFAVLHWDPAQSLFAFFLGALLCDVYEWTGRLWLVMLMHGSCNLTAILVNALSDGALPAGAALLMILASGLLLAGSFVFLARSTGRGAEKTKADRRQEGK